MLSPLMLSDKDDDLLGVAHRSDAMGFLAVWSTRARSLVPHLTGQTTEIRGFQILGEALRLWELYQAEHSGDAGRAADFFILVEQAFARTVAYQSDADWPLPGGRRVRARRTDEPHISLSDPGWHLLGAQKTNGLWGLYRGAAGRAGLLKDDLTRLADNTFDACKLATRFSAKAQTSLFSSIHEAMRGQTVAIPTRKNNPLAQAIRETFETVPLATHFRAHLVEGHDLNLELAQRLMGTDRLDHRSFMASAAHELPDHRETLDHAIRCENLIAVVESVFEWLCAHKGNKLLDVVADLPVDLAALETAKTGFANSGWYEGPTAKQRQTLLDNRLDTTSRLALANSVLFIHEEVSKSRGRATWVRVEDGILHGDVDLGEPTDEALTVGLAWRNDYYLRSLRSIVQQLEALGS